MHVPVAARDQPYAPPDLLVGLIRQVRQRHAKRPIRGFEAAAVQKYDPICLGQAEREIERMNIFLQVIDRFVTDILACPELEVDQAIIGVVILVWLELKAHGIEQQMDASVDDLLTGCLVLLVRIHHLAQREQAHHDLLRQ